MSTTPAAKRLALFIRLHRLLDEWWGTIPRSVMEAFATKEGIDPRTAYTHLRTVRDAYGLLGSEAFDRRAVQ